MRVSGPLTAVVLCTFSCFGGAPAIGTSDSGPVWNGTAIESGSSPNTISLETGVNVRLAPQSRGTVFSDHIVLDEGSVRVGSFGNYTVNARQLEIQAADPSAEGRRPDGQEDGGRRLNWRQSECQRRRRDAHPRGFWN